MFFSSSEKYPEVELLNCMVVLFLIFWGPPLTVFHTGCINFHSHSQGMKLPFSLHPCQHLFVVFLIVAILTGVRLYLTVVLTFISMMISDVQSVFLCLWSSTSCLWKNVYSSSLPIFYLSCFLCWVVWSFDICWILTAYQMYHLQKLSPIQQAAFCW